MSKFNWRNGFAIGLMLGIGLTAIVLVWGQLVYDFADCIAKGECERYATPYEGDNEPKWWGWTRRLVAAEDTLAQWVMAFFSILAVGLIWRTLSQTNKTNAAALKGVEAAMTANEIMRHEQRPWLQFEVEDFGLRYATRSDGMFMPYFLPKIVVANHGRRPAFWVTTAIEISVSDSWSVAAIDALIKKRDAERHLVFADVVFPSSPAIINNYGSGNTDIALEISGQDLGSSSANILVLLLYDEDEVTHYSAKFYTCRSEDLLPRPRIGGFMPLPMPFADRYT